MLRPGQEDRRNNPPLGGSLPSEEEENGSEEEYPAGVNPHNGQDVSGEALTREDGNEAGMEQSGQEEAEDGEEDPLIVLTRENRVLQEKIMRKQADIDNLRRISKQEQAEARQYALSQFLGRILPVVDNLERALEAARSDEAVPESHVAGLEMINRQLLQTLENEGVSIIEACGEPFDPHCHHAVMQVPDAESEPGIVLEELQKGYRHRDRILRPAMVKVCGEG